MTRTKARFPRDETAELVRRFSGEAGAPRHPKEQPLSLTRVVFASVITVGALAAAAASQASSPGAWAEFDQRVTRSCIAASGYRNARPSPIIGFDDRVGKVAMLVSDRSRGSNNAKLCLYDKIKRKAYIDSADGWVAPPQPQRR